MLNLIQKNYIRIIFLVSFVALISAYFIEYVLGHQPCNLCLMERIPYAIALVIIILNYKFNRLEKYFILLLSMVFLASTLLSLYHLGIEQGFIEESLVCDLQNSSKILSKEEILKQLQEKRVSCKDVTFKIFGLSLTTLNIIISILTTIVLTKIYLSYEKNK
jgi:disulfide bond formation protein DsbB